MMSTLRALVRLRCTETALTMYVVLNRYHEQYATRTAASVVSTTVRLRQLRQPA